MQGKTEQAEAIRKTILATEDVPWRVLTPESLEELKKEALDPDRYNRQAKLLLFDYAVIHHVPSLFRALARLKFRQAEDPFQNLAKIEQKYRRDYADPTRRELKKKLDRYGIDFRDPLNRTPLMLAARTGLADLARDLVKAGGHGNLSDNWGRNPLQIALLEAYRSEDYAKRHIGDIYPLLAPSSIKVKVQGRMIKIDQRLMEFFMLHSMIAMFQDIARVKTRWDLPAFETADFVHSLQHFPEHVIPERRKRRPYLSSILSKNEVNRDDPYNRFLFVRVCHGRYILNPLLEIDIHDEWINVYDLIGISQLEQEEDDGTYESRALRAVLRYVRECQARAAGPASVSGANNKPEQTASDPKTDSRIPDAVEELF
jgi:hypothetical protein